MPCILTLFPGNGTAIDQIIAKMLQFKIRRDIDQGFRMAEE
jgi:hypothetical protein